MKITKLILKNFAAVKTAMDTNEIEIDFSNAQNKICLLIGPNGSGKTTILSFLNPFSDVGNLDVRNGNHPILDDKEGYKEIHIQKDESLYIIKHFYSPHNGKSHSIKSYIEKNGKELNPNGNVSSFKEWVSLELQIESEYLKLIRLGSNVTSLIDLSSTERKNFMGRIMDDIGVYLEFHKSVGSKQRQLNEMISHTVDKLNRLGILDKEEYKKSISKKEKELKKTHDELLEVNSSLGILKDQLNKIDDIENLKENLKETTKKFEKMKKIISKKDSLESYDVSFYDSKIIELKNSFEITKNGLEAKKIILQNVLSQLDSLYNRLHSIQVQIDKDSEIDKEIERLNQNSKEIKQKLNEIESNLDGFETQITSKAFSDFLQFLKRTQSVLNTTYEFGKKPIRKIIELLKEETDVRKYINGHIHNIDEKRSDLNPYWLTKIYPLLFQQKTVITCSEECVAKKVYEELQKIIEYTTPKDKDEDIEYYRQMDAAYQNILTVLNGFKEYQNLILLLPDTLKKYFELTSLYKCIESLDVIYDEKKFNDFYAFIIEYETYIQLSIELDKINEDIHKFIKISKKDILINEIENTNSEISDYQDKIYELKKGISDDKELMIDISNSLDSYVDIKETLQSFDIVKERYIKLQQDQKTVIDLTKKISELQISYTGINICYNTLQKEIQDCISILDQYDKLSSELSKMNEIYDDLTLIRDALSSREGIPLYIIQRYLDNTENITNELLDIAYDGKIFLDKFNITPSEFSIPFYNKGIRLDDVKFASQGELSFLSIALSFALASQTLSKYNIMLLDEIDGPLDTNNRSKFIMILENQIERIHSEQNFLITHNDMFSSYPVDIIDLGFQNNHYDYPMANFIDIIKK